MPRLVTPTVKFPAIYLKDVNRLIADLYPIGRVIFQDDFDVDPLHLGFRQEAGGGLAAGGISRTTAAPNVFRGAGTLSMHSGNDASVDSVGFAEREICLPMSPRIGLAAWWMVGSTTNLRRIIMQLRYEHGDVDRNYRAIIQWRADISAMQYLDSGGIYRTIPEAPSVYGIGTNNWEYWKLVIDGENGEYVGAFLGGRYIDMSGIAMQTISVDEEHHVEFRVGMANIVNTADKYMYWDDLVVTCEE